MEHEDTPVIQTPPAVELATVKAAACECDCKPCTDGDCADCTDSACECAACKDCAMQAKTAKTAKAAALPATLEAPAKIQVEHFATAPQTASSANDSDRTIDVIWYAGASVPRYDWHDGSEYDLTLDMAGCRMDRLNNGGAVLDGHYGGSVQNQLGVTVKAWAEGKSGKATLRFSMRDSVTPIWEDVKNKIIQNLSPGIWIYQTKDTTEKGQQRKQLLAIDWEPFEISLVPVPADAGTEFMSADTGLKPVPAIQPNPAAAIQPPAVSTELTGTQQTMTPEQIAAAELARQTEVINAASLAAVQAGMQAERVRAAGIRQIVALAHLGETDSPVLINRLIDGGITLEAARVQVFEAMAAKTAATVVIPTGAVTRDNRDTFRSQIEAGILLRADPKGLTAEQTLLGRDFAGLSLVEVARECLNQCGVKTRGLYPDAIAKAALFGPRGAPEYFEGAGMMTTSDFPGILANVANKFLRQAYDAAPKTFMPFCRQVSNKDFKPRASVQLSDVPTLSKINEKGEFHKAALSDNKETYSLATYGEIIPITRKVIINDDLGAMTRIPAGLGQAAANLESDTVWGVITTNANLADAVALFHATHKNLNASNALALAGLAVARAAMRVVKGPKGTFLNLVPKYLIVPAALENAALQLIFPTQLAAATAGAIIPVWITNLTPIVEPRLDAVASVGATNWFMAADPSQIDGIEYCYLEGQQGVYIETRYGFEVDGVEIKARLDFAAAAVEPRGLQKNTA
jgi:hypothetical protein